MPPRWTMALLVLLRERWSARRDAQVRFLKLQLEIVRSRLPRNRVIPDPVERRRLMKIRAELGHAVNEVMQPQSPGSRSGRLIRYRLAIGWPSGSVPSHPTLGLGRSPKPQGRGRATCPCLLTPPAATPRPWVTPGGHGDDVDARIHHLADHHRATGWLVVPV